MNYKEAAKRKALRKRLMDKKLGDVEAGAITPYEPKHFKRPVRYQKVKES
jgi:hypothetical protein